MKKLIFFPFTMLLFSIGLFGQVPMDVQEATSLTKEAIRLMDNGEYDAAIAKLEKAKSLDSSSFTYDYEIAYAYGLQEQYPKAIAVMEALLERYEDASAQCFQMLGNYYDFNEEPEKATASYQRGLERFPKNGHLYMELGIVEATRRKDYDKALEYWEKGIEAEPYYPTNYYHAATVMAVTNEPMWSLIYGETFMLLEPTGKRNQDISKLMYEVLHDKIKISKKGKKTSLDGDLCSNVIVIDDPAVLESGKLLSFCQQYAISILIGYSLMAQGSKTAAKTGKLNLNELWKARETCLIHWCSSENSKAYPSALINFQKRALDAGQFEAYTYYVFRMGDPKEFTEWAEKEESKFQDFAKWMETVDILISEETPTARKALGK